MHHANRWSTGFWLLIGLLSCQSLLGADRLREQRIAEQIVDAILDGDTVYLGPAGQRFLAIFTRAEWPAPRGAALLLHGRGAHPDWPDVVHPLRTGLPAYGWDTLSIQLPVAAADAPDSEWENLIPAAAPRIDSALEFLRARGHTRIALIGHSYGARTALAYLGASGTAGKSAVALVAVGLPLGGAPARRAGLDDLGRIELPVLDIYGEQDLPAVVDGAAQRRLAAQEGGNAAYTQIRIAAADHFFTGQGRQLLGRVRAWLNRWADDRAGRITPERDATGVDRWRGP